jgi:methyltransferase (TIGR00027 family)
MEQPDLGARELRGHGGGEPAIPLAHLGAQCGGPGLGDDQQGTPAIGRIGLAQHEAVRLEARQRPRQRLRLYALDRRKVAGGQRAATVQMAEAVALTRARLERPHSPEGDPHAQDALCAGMQLSPPQWLGPSITARTTFVDAAVTNAIGAGLAQVVICGAGYDDRPLRFRTSGVRFIEIDHPATQADKARLLKDLGAGEPGVTLAPVDFRIDDTRAVLERAGHRASEPSLFVAEGLLIYLDQPTCGRLLAALAERAAPGSVLAVSLATHADGYDSAEVLAVANTRRRTGAAEPWQTILPAAEHLALLADADWRVAATEWSPVAAADVSHGRRSLLVTARI